MRPHHMCKSGTAARAWATLWTPLQCMKIECLRHGWGGCPPAWRVRLGALGHCSRPWVRAPRGRARSGGAV
eukprot:10064839-Alexandrium_andersonii.AAC.1